MACEVLASRIFRYTHKIQFDNRANLPPGTERPISRRSSCRLSRLARGMTRWNPRKWKRPPKTCRKAATRIALSHMALYDDQKVYMTGVIQLVLDVNSGRF